MSQWHITRLLDELGNVLFLYTDVIKIHIRELKIKKHKKIK